MRFFLILLFVFIYNNLSSQTTNEQSNAVLSFDEFFKLVQQNHPIVKQTILLNQSSQAELLGGKGGFDPKLYSQYEQKYFDSKNYFSFGNYGLKIPTWYGIELKGEYNTATGGFISPEHKLPTQGQAIFGIDAPLLQNFIFDERRAKLAKSKIASVLYKTEIDIITNDLTYEAAQIYWKWAFYYQQKLVFEQALRIASERFNAIKTAFQLGDRMAMDTLESFIQVQDRTLEYNRTLLEWQEISLKLSNFLWNSQGEPIENFSKLEPQILNNAVQTSPSLTTQQRESFIKNLRANHPLLKKYDLKINDLNIEKKLKNEKLKPKLNLQYNLLGNGFNWNDVFINNYKWGISFSTSTLLRTERADIQLAKIKIQDMQLLKAQKALELENKLQQSFNEIDNLNRQISLQTATLNNYQQLLTLENTRFELGESSFFLINSRENKYLEAQLKLAKLRAEYEIAKIAIEWGSGELSF